MKIAKLLVLIAILFSAQTTFAQTVEEAKFLSGFNEYRRTSAVQKSNFGERPPFLEPVHQGLWKL